MQLSSISRSSTQQQPPTQQRLNSSTVKAQQSAKVDALIIQTHLKTAAKDNSNAQSTLAARQSSSITEPAAAEGDQVAADGTEARSKKTAESAGTNLILQHLKRQIIQVKEQIAQTKEQLASAEGNTEQGNNPAVDAIANMLQSQQSHLSTLMSQYSKAVQEISQQSADSPSSTANFVDIKA
ncbi:MAG: hypothetical protein MJK13_02770 [Pseudomonadales bacterium]|nr:hypothetical protein [Pseudomonadales bacterium]